MNKWVMCQCPECGKAFIARLEQINKADPNNLYGFDPLPESLTCPYCGIKNDVYATHFPKVEL